jgi:hypothetical protein
MEAATHFRLLALPMDADKVYSLAELSDLCRSVQPGNAFGLGANTIRYSGCVSEVPPPDTWIRIARTAPLAANTLRSRLSSGVDRPTDQIEGLKSRRAGEQEHHEFQQMLIAAEEKASRLLPAAQSQSFTKLLSEIDALTNSLAAEIGAGFSD